MGPNEFALGDDRDPLRPTDQVQTPAERLAAGSGVFGEALGIGMTEPKEGGEVPPSRGPRALYQALASFPLVEARSVLADTASAGAAGSPQSSWHQAAARNALVTAGPLR